MGGSVSTVVNKITKEEEEEKEEELGEGDFGKTFKKGNKIIKRFKYDDEDNDLNKELIFYGWINSLKPEEQKHFSKLIEYKIYADTSFSHIPKTRMLDPDYQKKVEERNKKMWTVDLIIENKGRKIEPSKFNELTDIRKYKMLLQLLNIVRIMKKHNVCHEDIHPGNLVFDDKTSTLALIDYGITFLKGQRSVEIEARNEMLVQVTNMMVNLDAVFICSRYEKRHG